MYSPNNNQPNYPYYRLQKLVDKFGNFKLEPNNQDFTKEPKVMLDPSQPLEIKRKATFKKK